MYHGVRLATKRVLKLDFEHSCSAALELIKETKSGDCWIRFTRIDSFGNITPYLPCVFHSWSPFIAIIVQFI